MSVTTEHQNSGGTNWPIGWYLATAGFCFGVLVLMEPRLNPLMNQGVRTLGQFGLAMLLLFRLMLAIKRREQNHQGQLYIAVMLLLPVFWYLLERYLLPWMQNLAR